MFAAVLLLVFFEVLVLWCDDECCYLIGTCLLDFFLGRGEVLSCCSVYRMMLLKVALCICRLIVLLVRTLFRCSMNSFHTSCQILLGEQYCWIFGRYELGMIFWSSRVC